MDDATEAICMNVYVALPEDTDKVRDDLCLRKVDYQIAVPLDLLRPFSMGRAPYHFRKGSVYLFSNLLRAACTWCMITRCHLSIIQKDLSAAPRGAWIGTCTGQRISQVYDEVYEFSSWYKMLRRFKGFLKSEVGIQERDKFSDSEHTCKHVDGLEKDGVDFWLVVV